MAPVYVKYLTCPYVYDVIRYSKPKLGRIGFGEDT